MQNLVFIDVTCVTALTDFLTCLTPNTDYVAFSLGEPFSRVKERVPDKQYENVAILQHNHKNNDYALMMLETQTESSRVLNVATMDPNLDTWYEIKLFFAWLRDTRGMKNMDLLACDLWVDDDWKYIVGKLESQLNINVRASIDVTGMNGNYMLESDNVDTIGLYFTEDVKNYPQNFYSSNNNFRDQNKNLILDGSGGTVYKTKYDNVFQIPSVASSGTYIAQPFDISNVIQVMGSQNPGPYGDNSYAVLRKDGSVVRWGHKDQAMKYVSTTTDPSLTNVKRLFSSRCATFVALKNDGTVVGWGNAGYSFGVATDINTDTTRVKGLPAGLTDVKEIYVNDDAYWALKTDGTIVSWGVRDKGGDTSLCQSLLVNVVKVTTVNTGFVALRSDGNIVLCGQADSAGGVPCRYATTVGNAAWGGKIVDFYGISWGMALVNNNGSIGIYQANFSPTNVIANTNTMSLGSPWYTLPAGVTVDYVEEARSGFYYLSNNTCVQFYQSTPYVRNSAQLALNDAYDSGWLYPTIFLNASGAIQSHGSGSVSAGANPWDATHGIPAGSDISNNVVQIYSSQLGFMVRKSTGSVVSWGNGLRYDSATAGITDVVHVYELVNGFRLIRSTGDVVHVTNGGTTYTNGALPIPAGKTAYFYDGNPRIGSLTDNIVVELDVEESVSPSSITAYTPTTVSFKSNRFQRLAKCGIKYGLYANGLLLSTFVPQVTTMTYEFKNVIIPNNTTSLSVGIAAVNFANTMFSFNVSTINNPNVTLPDSPTITSVVVNKASSSATVNFALPSWDGGIPVYIMKYSLNGGSTYTTTSTTSPLSLTGLSQSSYNFALVATSYVGDSYGASYQIIMRDLPVAPIITGVTTGDGTATISFTAGATNGRPITSYQYSLNGGSYLSIGTTTSPITISGLTNGSSYTVRLRAVNVVGISAPSALSSAFVPYSVPGAPIISSVTPGNGSVTVTVINPYLNGTDSNGISITGYSWSTDNSTFTYQASASNTFTITGLTNGTSYTLRVKAVTSIGSSPASAASSAFIPKNVPGAPTILSVVPFDQKALVYFADGTNSSSITGYKYTVNGSQYYTALETSSPLTIYGLDNATNYNIQLKAVNEMGDSPASASSSSITPFGVPSAPVISEIVPGNGCAFVYFDVSNNGSPIIKYKYYIGTTIMDASGLTSPLTIPNLINKRQYNVYIIATNAAGDSYASNIRTVITGASTPPVITQVIPGPKNIQVFFTPPPTDNGSPITHYNVTYNGIKYTKVTGLVSPVTLTRLTNGFPYSVTFQAANKNGVSKNSNTITGVIPYDIPAKIRISSVTARLNSALVAFTPPLNNGSPITKYAYALNADTTYTDISGLVPPLTIPGMPNNTLYTLKLVAYNAAGMSPVSAPSKSVMYVYTPPAQIKLKSIVAAKNSLIVDFTYPAANGAPITGYKYALNSDTVYTSAGTTTVPFTITGLANNTNYNIKLIATNEVGDSIPSLPAAKSVMFVFLPPAAPVVSTIIGGNQSGIIKFTAPKTKGAPITGYKYSVDGGATKIDLSGVVSPLTATGLTNDTSYNLLLYADSEAGLSPPSAVKSFKPVYSVPGVPVIRTIINMNGGASVSFRPGLANGSPITEYLYSLDGGVTKINTGSTSLTFSITGLTNDLSYNILMYAVNAVGSSPASRPKAFMPVYRVPAAPKIGTISTTTSTASVAFTPGLANGAPITSYRYSIDAGATWVSVSQLARPIIIGGLTTKAVYSIVLRAVNEVGESLSSPSKSFTMK